MTPPSDPWMSVDSMHSALRRHRRCVEIWDSATRANPKDVHITELLANELNDLAWLQATSWSKEIRNGSGAIEAAQRACQLTNWKNSKHLSTLAASHATVGDFDSAVRFQKRAIEASEEPAIHQKRLKLYESQQPFHERFQNPVNLGRFYNARLNRIWHGDWEGNHLGELPTGIQEFGGITFDIGGILQLNQGDDEFHENQYPEKVDNLPIQGNVKRVHFLHGCIFGHVEDLGTAIGKYVIRYADETSEERVIKLGEDMFDWCKPRSLDEPAPLPVWTGENDSSRRLGYWLHLYKTTWENPQPDIEITGVDFVSAGNIVEPFLVAITTE